MKINSKWIYICKYSVRLIDFGNYLEESNLKCLWRGLVKKFVSCNIRERERFINWMLLEF